MILDIGIMGNWATQLMAIGGVLAGIYWICYQIFAVKTKIQEHDDCISDSLEERQILLRAQKATLEAVSGKRCNGNVDDSINEIDDYMMRKSHEK